MAYTSESTTRLQLTPPLSLGSPGHVCSEMYPKRHLTPLLSLVLRLQPARPVCNIQYIPCSSYVPGSRAVAHSRGLAYPCTSLGPPDLETWPHRLPPLLPPTAPTYQPSPSPFLLLLESSTLLYAMPSPTRTPRPTAPRDYLQFFLSVLDQRHADALSFTDTTGAHQLFIARDREAALHSIQQDSEQTRAHLLDLDGGISDTDLARLADAAVPGPARSS